MSTNDIRVISIGHFGRTDSVDIKNGEPCCNESVFNLFYCV